MGKFIKMKPKNILITGGCGFIGSNLVLHLAKKYPNYKLNEYVDALILCEPPNDK